MKKLLLLIILSPLAGFGQLQFTPKVAYPLTTATGLITSGDLDGDNIADMVSPNGNLVTIYLGTGSGNFNFHQDIDVGGQAAGTLIHDFNGDNIPDLAVANTISTNIIILLGTGGGNFLPPAGYSLSSIWPKRPVTADFDNDGYHDLAVTTFGGVTIVLSNGPGTFGPPTTYPAGTNPIELVTRDFDSDGDKDLAVQSDFELIILSGNGDGTFNNTQTIGIYGTAEHIISEDFTGDGFPDLLIGNQFEVSLVKGIGDGSFDAPQFVVGLNPNGLVAKDFNSDGKLDFAAVNYSGLNIYLGDGSGNFSWSQSFGSGKNSDHFLIDDFNSDGRLDIVSTSLDNPNFYVSLGVPYSLQFSPGVSHPTGFGNGFRKKDIGVADFNGDGHLDMVASNYGKLSLIRGTGQGCFSLPNTFTTNIMLEGLAIGDLNGDTKPDVVGANGTDRTVSVFINTGSGFLPMVNYASAEPASGYGSVKLAIGDLNTDGKADLVVVNNDGSGSISILMGNGDGTFNPKVNYPTLSSPTSVAIADVNGDNKPDLAVANPNSYIVRVLINNGTGDFPLTADYFTSSSNDVVFADFNNDSNPDIATSSANNMVGVMLNDGAGGFLNELIYPTNTTFNSPNTISAADMNNDGHMDVVAVSYNQKVSIVLGDGQGDFLSNQNFDAGPGPGYDTYELSVGDMDEDGRVDILVLNTSLFDNQIYLFRTSPTPCISPPNISSFNPSSGAAGTIVEIYGSNFSDTFTDNVVLFNGVPATLIMGNPGYIRATVPSGATTGSITVTSNSFTNISASPFTVPLPSITGFSPTLGIGGESIVITGTGFSPVPSMNIVKFNGTTAIVTASTATSITTTVPVGATTGVITVQVEVNTATSGSNFTVVQPPTISSFSPTSGPSGTSVTISGANFDPILANNTVRVGGIAATITGGTTTSLTMIVPVSAVNGQITVSVSGYTGTSSLFFRVNSPTPSISGFSPATGPIGTTVTITGSNFNLIPANNIVRFGTVNANVISVTPTSMQVAVPLGTSYNPISLTINEYLCETKVPFIVTFEGFQQIDNNSFNPLIGGGTPSRRAAAGDINGDGTIDYVAAMMDWPTYNLRVFSGSSFVNLPTAVSNKAEALQDINGDGKPELLAITGNGLGNTLHIFRNTSVPGVINAGTFAPKIDFAYGNAGILLIKDIDGDGKPDLVRSQNTTTFTIHRNTSEFGVIDVTTFATLVNITTTSNVTVCDVGDVDGDGKPDLVTTSGSFFRNTSSSGTISFGPKEDLISGTFIYVLADINRDEKLDVIGNNGVLLNTSTIGTFSFAPIVSITGISPFSVKVADLDGDGLPDLAYAAARISVFRNTSTLTTASFAPKADFGDIYDYIGTNIGGGVHSILDIDGDGKMDLLYGHGGIVYNALITGSAPKVPVVSGFSPDSGPVGTTVTISGSNFSTTPSSNIVYFGTVKGTVISSTVSQITAVVPPGSTDQPISVTVSGFSGYSKKPFVVLFSTNGVIDASTFSNAVSFGTGTSPIGVSIGDTNGDGKPDIGLADGAGSGVFVYQNNTVSGTFNSSSLLAGVVFGSGAGPTDIEIADMDGDGRLDLASSNYTPGIPNGKVSVNRNISGTGTINSGFFASGTQSLTDYHPRGMTVGDIDGDGKPEMATVSLIDKKVNVYKNINQGTTKPSHRVSLATTGSSLVTGVSFSDIDGDGKLDVVITYQGQGISIFRNTSTVGLINSNSFAPRVDIPVPFNSEYTKFDIRDLDGDDKPDIVKPNPNNNTISILRNISTLGSITAGSFEPQFTLATGLGPNSVTIGDLDGDGKREITVTNGTSNTFSVFKNVSVTGTLDASSFLARVDFATPAGPQRISIGDLDGDTKPDMAVTSSGAHVLSIFHNEKILIGASGPTITSFTPTSAATGTTVAITGTNFTGTTSVSFAGTASSSFIVTSPTTIDAVVGAGTSGSVSVTTPVGTASLAGFTFISAPTITSFTPISSGTGSTVTITGTNFTGTTAVTFGGIAAASFTITSSTSIDAVVGAGATGSVSVTTTGGTATRSGFTHILLPTITGFTPTSGLIGISVTITGTNFDAVPANNTVTFGGGVVTPVSSGTTTNLVVNVPAGAITGNISVTVGASTAVSPTPFVVTSPPTIVINPQPLDVSVCDGVTAQFAMSASGTTNLVFQWQFALTSAGPFNDLSNGGGYSGVNTTTLSINTSGLFGAGSYRCKVDGDLVSTAYTNDAALTVYTVPSLPVTTNSSPACSPASVIVTASGGSSGEYRWYTVGSGGTPIAGQTNANYTTPVISSTTTYFVSLNNGSCESTRTSVDALINPLPASPTTTGAAAFAPASVVLTAAGATSGEYRWYTSSTGSTLIAGEVNDNYTTPVLSTPTTYFVTIDNGTCESIRVSVLANVKANEPPIISSTTPNTTVEGNLTVDLNPLVSDPDNNLDMSSMTIIIQPASGALASIDAIGNLIIDYAGIPFSGSDKITISICDALGLCTQREFTIEVAGNIAVYNALSPNGDQKNDIFYIEYIDILENTKENKVTIFNRWGDTVFTVDNYNNESRVFQGLDNNGNDLPAGTYYYRLDFVRESRTGFISLKR